VTVLPIAVTLAGALSAAHEQLAALSPKFGSTHPASNAWLPCAKGSGVGVLQGTLLSQEESFGRKKEQCHEAAFSLPHPAAHPV
jgi:hypothetical protein